MGVQVRVPGAGVAVGERRRHQAAGLDLPDAALPDPGVQRFAFEERQRIGDRGKVGPFDLGGDLRVGQRPQRRHALDRRERQVVAGHRRRLLPGQPRQMPGQFAGVQRVAAELGTEHLAGDVGADPGPDRQRDRRRLGRPDAGVVGGERLRHLHPERRHVVGEHRERLAQPDRRRELGLGELRPRHLDADPIRQRMKPGPEQRPHLLGGHHVPGGQAVDAGQPGSHPHPGGFAALGVVGRQRHPGVLGRVMPRHLPGQVVIPGPRRDLVQRHRHTLSRPPPRAVTDSPAAPNPEVPGDVGPPPRPPVPAGPAGRRHPPRPPTGCMRCVGHGRGGFRQG